jgi:hypothetical protein
MWGLLVSRALVSGAFVCSTSRATPAISAEYPQVIVKAQVLHGKGLSPAFLPEKNTFLMS